MPSAASAIAPKLTAVGAQRRHPSATFSAPRAGTATIYLASRPDRASDGSFLTEDVVELDVFTDAEIQAGRWLDERQVDPGRYYVLLRAFPDLDTCYALGDGTYDPGCADGFSNMLRLVVPKPVVRYAARVSVYRYLRDVSLELRASPLGERRPYRVCYPTRARKRRCLAGTLDGFSWNAGTEDTLTASTAGLAATTTFTWYVSGKAVARKRVRVR
jgi:hypothetical protein